METPPIVDRAHIAPPSLLDAAWFSGGGRVIDDLGAVLSAFEVRPSATLAEALPEVVNDGVNRAPTGVIQDPAGTAVGARTPSGGGVSGRIYAQFTDLRGIPHMPVGAAVFNSSTGPGRRILHTHASVLAGDPDSAADRAIALVGLATAYGNAMLAFVAHADALGVDGGVLNLVPVSGSIFARSFANSRDFTNAHLDPSYSLAAIVVALAHVGDEDVALPRTTLSYFARDVYERAIAVHGALHDVLAA